MKILLKNRNKKTPKEIVDACNGNEFLARILWKNAHKEYHCLYIQ